jgi:hypothetical protein
LRDQLEAKKPVTHRGAITEWVPDNPARGSANSLFADVLGIKQKQLNPAINLTENKSVIVIMPPEEIVRKEVEEKSYEILEEEFLKEHGDDGEEN